MTPRFLMPHDTSNKTVVKCDICQDPMTKGADAYVCYECKNLIYASDLWRYPTQVEIKNASNDS